MSRRENTTDIPTSARDEVRDTVVKSTLTGVAATVVAVTVCSPAGLGGFIGTGLANGVAPDSNANLIGADSGAPVFPDIRTPLSSTELTDIRTKLRDSASALDQARRNTDSAIEMLRTMASVDSSSETSMASGPRATDVELARLLLTRSQNG